MLWMSGLEVLQCTLDGKVKVNDEVEFDVVSITEIREMDDYFGFRVSLIAGIGTMKIPLKIDITTGDKIIPSEISYEYPLMFENRSIKIKAYNLETILSEKIETVISRGNQNTRMRDFLVRNGNVKEDNQGIYTLDAEDFEDFQQQFVSLQYLKQ